MQAGRAAMLGLRGRILALIALVAGPLLFLMLLEARQERTEALVRARQDARALAQIAAEQQDDALQEARTLVRVLAQVPEIRGADPAPCQALLQDVRRAHPHIIRVQVLAPDGSPVCSDGSSALQAGPAGADWFRALAPRDAPPTVASGVIDGPGMPHIAVAARIPGTGDGAPFAGAVAAEVDLAGFAPVAQRMTGSGVVRAGLVDPESGTVLVAGTDWRGMEVVQTPDPALVAAVRAMPHGGTLETARSGHAPEIIGFAPLPAGLDTHPVTFLALSRQGALAGAEWRLLRTVAVTIAGGLAALVLGWMLAWGVLISPLRLLAQAAQAIGDGHLDRRVPAAALGAPELRKLGETLNRMADGLQAQRADLAKSEELHRILTENVTDLVMLLDAAFTRLYVSPAAREVLGYAPEALIGTSPLHFVHPEDQAFVQLAIRAMRAGEPRIAVTMRCVRRDGEVIWAEMRVGALEGGRGFVATLRDITASHHAEQELIEANRHLVEIAGQDALTGVANRRRFDELLGFEWRRGLRDRAPLSLLLIDVDHFKAFNDHYGHLKGDACLRRIAGVLKQALRRAADLVARYGGEEFAVILPATAQEDALVLAERARGMILGLGIEHRASPEGRVTVSIGVASLVPDLAQDGPNVLIEQADAALYMAKRRGRDRVVQHQGRMMDEDRIAQ